MAKRKREYMYGKAHHIKYPYTMRIYNACDRYLEKVRDLPSECQIGNLIVDLRNEMYRIVEEIYQHLYLQLKHDIVITPEKRGRFEVVESSTNQQCEICGEQRATNKCHIIPREDGGSDLENNIVYLCPTHHFLFDNARLSRDEFEKINVSGKAADSVDFFLKIHTARHQMYWKYGTNKNAGCTCGSLDFEYDAAQNGNFVQPCLVCQKCKEVWFLGVYHPLLEELSIEVYGMFDQITEEEKQKRVNEAKKSVRAAIAERGLNSNC